MKSFILFLFLFSYSVMAHPVIYKDGWVYWGHFTDTSSQQRLSYTFHPRFSVEFNAEKILMNDEGRLRQISNYKRDFKIGLNTLVKRWYLNDSQANIYASLHAGFSSWLSPENYVEITEGEGHPLIRSTAFLTALLRRPPLLDFERVLRPQIDIDWESQKNYTAFRAAAYLTEENEPLYRLMYRQGFAPYIGGMKELQTWFVVQADYAQQGDKGSFKMTPLLRFFYRNALWEIGMSTSGDGFLTIMLHH